MAMISFFCVCKEIYSMLFLSQIARNPKTDRVTQNILTRPSEAD